MMTRRGFLAALLGGAAATKLPKVSEEWIDDKLYPTRPYRPASEEPVALSFAEVKTYTHGIIYRNVQ